MSTRQITLTPDWQQITDGAQTLLIQVFDRTALVCDSEFKPAADAAAHVVSGFVTLTPPTIAWMRAEVGTARIVLTDNG